MEEKDIKTKAAEFFNQALPVTPKTADHVGSGVKPKLWLKHLKWQWYTYLCGFILVAGIIGYATFPRAPIYSYTGQITFPSDGSESSRNIKIIGNTENLPPELPYAVVAVDVPDLRLSWPKSPFIKPNTTFQISFQEGGPSGKCVVSLYVVNHDTYNKITQWFKEDRLGGMPLLPDRFRLDSVTLTLQQ